MRYIVIEKNKATRALEELANSNVEMIVLRIPTASEGEADIELETIDNDCWISSDDYIETNGESTDSILLPKKAINA